VPVDTPTSVGWSAQETLRKPIGRFAPSPTNSGLWYLRIDDIDGPRSVPGSADSIQHTLAQYGFEWDGPIHWQSTRLERYQNAVSELVQRQLVFHCECSRRSLPSGKVYPGTCRNEKIDVIPSPADYHKEDHALRCVLSGQLKFVDTVQGRQNIVLQETVGDIIIWRRDNLVAYALACAVDDAQNVTQVVRGADLLANTAAQVAIMNALDLPVPQYAHIPVAIDANGDKLSKHSKAQSINSMQPLSTLLKAWRFLGQTDIHPTCVAGFWTQLLHDPITVS